MSRDFKFRAWQPHNSYHRKPGMYLVDDIVWYGEPDAEDKTGEVFLTKKLGTSRSSEYLEDISLMQYTGLKDKNGVEIYEGDICRYVAYDGKVYIQEMHLLDNYHFWGHVADNLDDEETNPYEVLGNIYENHELLTKEAK